MSKRKDVPVDYEIDVEVLELMSGYEKKPDHTQNIHIEGDDQGFERKYVLSASDWPNWNPTIRNKPMIEIEDHDLDYEVTIHRPGKEPLKFETNITEMRDLRTLLEVVHRVVIKTKENRMGLFGKTKMGKITKKVEIK